MADSPTYVIKATSDGHAQITRLFDFINPAIIALWNLRWQVDGFYRSTPGANWQTLRNRFALGSEMRGGELKRACIDNTWEDQREQFAELILVGIIAIFEDFTASVVHSAGLPSPRHVSEAMQFPPKIASTDPNGCDWAFSQFGPVVPALTGVFYAGHMGRYSGLYLTNLMLCYRYFKSIRNMLAHNGRRANQRMIDDYLAFSAVANPGALGLVDVPVHHPVVLGDRVSVDLKGVTTFCNVVLRIMATWDAELSDRDVALREIRERVVPLDKRVQFPPSDVAKRANRLKSLMLAAKFPPSVLTSDFQQLLKSEGKVPSFY